MKKLILILLLLLVPSFLYAQGMQPAGGVTVTASTSCTSGTLDWDSSSGTHCTGSGVPWSCCTGSGTGTCPSSGFTSGVELKGADGRGFGQHFRFGSVGSTGKIYSILVGIDTVLTSGRTFSMRFGACPDLSSAADNSFTVVSGDVGNYKEIVIANHDTVNTSTTYCWDVVWDTNGSSGTYIASNATVTAVTNFAYDYSDVGSVWVLANPIPTAIYKFQVKYCD